MRAASSTLPPGGEYRHALSRSSRTTLGSPIEGTVIGRRPHEPSFKELSLALGTYDNTAEVSIYQEYPDAVDMDQLLYGVAIRGTFRFSGNSDKLRPWPWPMKEWDIQAVNERFQRAAGPAPGGSATAVFTATTYAVATPTSVTISASAGGTTQTAGLTVNPPPTTVTSLALNPTNVVGGNPSQGTVTLSGPAPVGGATIALSSSSNSVA